MAIAGYDVPYGDYWDDEEDRERANAAYWADWDMREQEAVDRYYGITQ